MTGLGKCLCLCSIAIFAASTLLLPLVNAQTIPKPTVPEFSLSLVGPAYIVPTTYHLDQNTGQIVVDIGYTNEYSAVVVTIKNQLYDTAYGSLFYNIRLKNHEWNDSWLYPLDNLFRMFQTYPTQSTDSDYTNVTLTIQSNSLLVGVQNDIQVEAMLGDIGRHQQYSDSGQYLGAPYVFSGQTSDWSNTQTVNIPTNVPIASDSTPNPSSTLPSMGPTSPPKTNSDLTVTVTLIIIGILVIIVISLLFYVMRLKRRTVKN